MKARDFLTEREYREIGAAPLSHSKYYPDMPSSDPYQLYRFSLNIANPEAETQGPAARNAVIVAYTPEEDQLIAQAEQVTGKRGKTLTSKRSIELHDVNTVSPIKPQPAVKKRS
jgi:hypothetical protein